MPRRRIPPVCNLYSSYTTQEAMRRAFEVNRDSAGNVPPLPAIFPDQMAPVVRTVDGERELIQMRWGFPPPPQGSTQPVTNVRNVGSPFWRAWLKPQHRPRSSDELQRVQGHQAAQDTCVVRFEQGPAACRLRRHLAALDGRARHQGRTNGGRAPALFVPHIRAERRRRSTRRPCR